MPGHSAFPNVGQHQPCLQVLVDGQDIVHLVWGEGVLHGVDDDYSEGLEVHGGASWDRDGSPVIESASSW